MVDLKEESRYLASLSVFRELYDSQKDIYGVICAFLNEIIITHGKYKFGTSEITNLLNSMFEFSIPEAVVSTSLNRLDYLNKSHGKYTVTDLPNKSVARISDLQGETITNNETIIHNLFSFIENEKKTELSESEKNKIVQAFVAFLLDDNVSSKYSEFISGFIIKNQSDDHFRNRMNKIREGVILYSGIKYTSDLGELGSWRSDLAIYLDTEILFHFAGYNGVLYETLFLDFFNLVREINQRAKKKLIRLKYFKEVKNEIDGFFAKAENIVSGKERLNPSVTAMDSIVDGCNTASDVLEKKSDFCLFLENHGIYESQGVDFSDNANYEYNIVGKEIVNSISQDFPFDISEHLKFLNYISLKREEGNFTTSFDNIGYILLTGNMKTINVALHEKVKSTSQVPLATTLNWITNKFWFKLNKGFGNNGLPKSFDVITQAQIVLSAIIDRSVSEKYDELLSKFREGNISEDQAKSRIINLRSQARKPEEIKQDEISSILEVLSRDKLEDFVQEQNKLKSVASKHAKENVQLKRELEDSRRSKEKFRDEKKAMIEIIESNKKRSRDMALKEFRRFKFFIGAGLIIWWLMTGYLIWNFNWDAIEPWFTLFSLAFPFLFSSLYLLVKEKNWNPKDFLEKKKENFIEQKHSEFNIDIQLLKELKKDVQELEEEISK